MKSVPISTNVAAAISVAAVAGRMRRPWVFRPRPGMIEIAHHDVVEVPLRHFFLIASLYVVTSQLACIGTSEPQTDPPSFSIDATAISLMVGEHEQLTAVPIDDDGSPSNQALSNVSWESSAPEVASVGEAGLVIARTAGRVIISASTNGISDTVSVTVNSSEFPAIVTQSVAVGGANTCAVRFNAALFCWGSTARGNLGIGVTSLVRRSLSPQAVVSLQSTVSVVSGSDHTCALSVAGKIACWGDNLWGQVGTVGKAASVPTLITTDTLFNAITAGAALTCGLARSSTILCWGRLGSRSLSAPTVVKGPGSVQVTAGGMHACTLDAEGAVECWGRNDYGQLGNGSTQELSTPTRILDQSRYLMVSAGFLHTCGVTTEHIVKCWGNNFSGRLGTSDENHREVPAIVNLPGLALSVSAGAGASCAVLSDGRAFCWGDNSRGQLGNNLDFGAPATPSSAYRSTSPVEVAGPAFTSVIAGHGVHTCGITIAGTLYCWGGNDSGALGVGQRQRRSADQPSVSAHPQRVRSPQS